MPFISYMWNGEGFNFNGGPGYWLIEIASRHAGLTGDMLGGGPGSLWKGMLFGMTQRNNPTSSALWAFWDATRINETTSVGWWQTAGGASASVVPIVPNATCADAPDPEHSQVLATVFVAYGSHAVVALASFCPSATTATFPDIDWAAMGLDAATTQVSAPAIAGVQMPETFPDAAGPYNLPGDGGMLLLFAAPGQFGV